MTRPLTALTAALLACASAIAGTRPTETAATSLPPRVRALHAEPIAGLLPDGAAGPMFPAMPLRIDEQAWQTIDAGDVAWLDEVPLSDGDTVDLRLTRLDPFARSARIVVMEAGANGQAVERELPLPHVSAWAGTVAGRPGSRAFIARSDAGLQGYIQFDGRTEVISSGPQGAGGTPMISDAAALPPGDFTCGGGLPHPIEATRAGDAPRALPLTAACRQLPLAFDTDQELLAKFSGNTTSASAYVATLVAALMDIYQRDFNARPSISYLRWWATTDPWTQAGTCGGAGSDQLGELRNYWNANMQSVPRALTALLSARNLGGGCAWLWATCENPFDGYGYSVSANLAGSFP